MFLLEPKMITTKNFLVEFYLMGLVKSGALLVAQEYQCMSLCFLDSFVGLETTLLLLVLRTSSVSSGISTCGSFNVPPILTLIHFVGFFRLDQPLLPCDTWS